MIEQYMNIISSALSVAPEQIQEYPSSYVQIEKDQFLLCKISDSKWILAMGCGTFFSQLEGNSLSPEMKLCPLSHENRLVMNKSLPHTAPSSFGRQTATFGLGDRLGIATPGHIRCFSDTNIKPILAQQSKRELDLTQRSYSQVLDDVSFAVFQEGYRGGFGADGDHLKKLEDIQDALDCGYTMITLDCSEKIGHGIELLSDEEVFDAYQKQSHEYRARIEETYLSKGFLISGEEYTFTKSELARCALIYGDSIGFIKEVYFNCLKKAKHPVDFELSIDETESITTPCGHLFVAMELEHEKVEITSLAPRFIGDFQKGIDYIGDRDQFEIQLRQHASIADYFGYKLSIHSGSDKFSVFPFIGMYTGGRLHLKTSGTSWLEAVSVIAERNPLLYRKIHQKALEHFEEARSYYKVSADSSKVEELKSKEDSELIDYLKKTDSRQLLHITYGFILEDKILRREIYQTLNENEDHYYARLISHIGRHLDLLDITD